MQFIYNTCLSYCIAVLVYTTIFEPLDWQTALVMFGISCVLELIFSKFFK